MRGVDVVLLAARSLRQGRARTVLSASAVVVGAFALTITTGLGAGINQYIDDSIATIGADDVMFVTKPADPASTGDGPTEYRPDLEEVAGANPSSSELVQAMTQTDLDVISALPGVESALANPEIEADYIQSGTGTRYEIGVGAFITGAELELAAGRVADDGSTRLEVVIPLGHVSALGFDDARDALGREVRFGVTDAVGGAHVVEATVVGVSAPTIATDGESAIPGAALTDALLAAAQTGLSDLERSRFTAATLTFDAEGMSADEVAVLREALAAEGYDAQTVTDLLGSFRTAIDLIVVALSAFAVITLLAAGLGIVNTLLMSVRERTRQIGLMKAMGLGSAAVFARFSIEAALIGLLGAAVGAAAGVGLGLTAGPAIASALAAGLPGLTLFAFAPVTVAAVLGGITVVAFAAGTIPALRAAAKDPITSLRHE